MSSPITAIIILVFSSISLSSFASEISEAQQLLEQSHRNSAQVQVSIDKSFQALSAKAAEYQLLERKLQRLEVHNGKLEQRLVQGQEAAEQQQSELESIALTAQQIEPLMQQMQQSLESLIAADLPFMVDQRLAKAKAIREIIADPEVSLAIKFQKLVAGFVEEDGYGRDVQAYRATLRIEGVEREVNMIRLGRVALYYLSLDQAHAAFYNVRAKRWVDLPAQMNSHLARAIDVAKEQGVPQLLTLQLPQIEEGQ